MGNQKMNESRPMQLVPTVVFAVVLGLSVNFVGTASFSLLLSANLNHGASVPWACAVELVVLWLLCRYLLGWGWPKSTSARRRQLFRANRVKVHSLCPAIVATVLLGVSIGFLVYLAYMLVPFPEEAGETFLAISAAPPVTAVSLIVTLAVVSGIVEEGAFRGYMQVPLEKDHRPATGITVVAAVFVLAHHPPLLVFPLFLIGAAGWGILARLVNSTVPGMIAHASVDAVILLGIWHDPQGFEALLARSVAETGVDMALVLTVLAALVSIVATSVAFVWLGRHGN